MSRKKRCSCKGRTNKKHTFQLTRTLCAALSQLCWVFCCPPCPPCIIRKIAFHPPKPPTYKIVTTSKGMPKMVIQDESLKILPLPQMRSKTILLYEKISTCMCREHKKIVAMQWLHTSETSRSNLVILHSHVNAADLGTVQFPMETLARRTGCDVIAYDYSGYGGSDGSPSEDVILRNADMVMKYINDVLHRPPSDVIVYGQSIGSVPTWYLASKYDVAGVIQLSGLYSGWRTLNRESGSIENVSQSGCCCLNPFNNAGLVKEVRSPVLLIHGKADEVIQFSHAVELLRLCGAFAVPPLWIDGIGHVGIERTREFYERVNKFLHEEVRRFAAAQLAVSNSTISSRSADTPSAAVPTTRLTRNIQLSPKFAQSSDANQTKSKPIRSERKVFAPVGRI